jgi:DNA polymerase-4
VRLSRATSIRVAEAVGAWRLVTGTVEREGAGVVQLKIRLADFHTLSRARTLLEPTNITDEIARTSIDLLENCSPAARQRIRLLGVGVSGLDVGRAVQRSLFENEERQKLTQLDQATDSIRQRFGSSALHRGSGLLHDAEHHPAPRPDSRRDADRGG